MVRRCAAPYNGGLTPVGLPLTPGLRVGGLFSFLDTSAVVCYLRDMKTAALKWERLDTPSHIGWKSGNIEITDNGDGYGARKGGGRWALMVDGKWIANIDTLAEAKARASEF